VKLSVLLLAAILRGMLRCCNDTDIVDSDYHADLPPVLMRRLWTLVLGSVSPLLSRMLGML
jgi:hypothetical protein